MERKEEDSPGLFIRMTGDCHNAAWDEEELT
jgi:hypothetical protein